MVISPTEVVSLPTEGGLLASLRPRSVKPLQGVHCPEEYCASKSSTSLLKRKDDKEGRQGGTTRMDDDDQVVEGGGEDSVAVSRGENLV